MYTSTACAIPFNCLGYNFFLIVPRYKGQLIYLPAHWLELSMTSSCFTWQFTLCSPELTSALHHLPVKESLRDEAAAQGERRGENIIVIQSLGVSSVSHRFPAETRRTTDGSPQEEEAWGWMCMYAFVRAHLFSLKRNEIVTVKAL